MLNRLAQSYCICWFRAGSEVCPDVEPEVCPEVGPDSGQTLARLPADSPYIDCWNVKEELRVTNCADYVTIRPATIDTVIVAATLCHSLYAFALLLIDVIKEAVRNLYQLISQSVFSSLELGRNRNIGQLMNLKSENTHLLNSTISGIQEAPDGNKVRLMSLNSDGFQVRISFIQV
jgi:hypothetical protein